MPLILVTIKLHDFAFCLIRVTMVLSMLRCHGNSKHLEMAIIYVVLLSIALLTASFRFAGTETNSTRCETLYEK